MIEIVIFGHPQGKGRARSTKTGHHYTPQKTRDYEKQIALAGAEAMITEQIIMGAVKVEMLIFCPVLKKFSKKTLDDALTGKIRPTSKPDVDNVCKAVFDGLNGIVYKDDKQIVSLSVEKYYSLSPQIRLKISEI